MSASLKISPLLLRPLLRTAFTTSSASALAMRRSLSCSGHHIARFSSTTASPTAAHIIARVSSRTRTEAAKPDWAKQFKRAGGNAIFYFPFFATFLTWPIIAEKAIEWSQGVE